MDAVDANDSGDVASESVCNGGRVVCHAHIRLFGAERSRSPRAVTPAAALPAGFGPADLQSAYGIDPTRLATAAKPTVAVTDAYGYPNLESDLAVYRQTYGLPPCTIANKCLQIINQRGDATVANLPPPPPAGDDWTIETALDVDMVSAACPQCNILVVQADDDQGPGLDDSQNTAAAHGATVISDSWDSIEQSSDVAKETQFYRHPGVAIFVASGDSGFEETIQPAPPPPAKLVTGPGYPATSQYTIAVGGTHLTRQAGTARGWAETAWAVVTNATTGQVDLTRGAGGSGCSRVIPKPTYQSASPCGFKANADIAAVADPATGMAVYNSNGGIKGNWGVIGGTSAASPFVAAIFAATGNGSQTSGQFIADNVSKMFDVIGGTNGTCPTGKELLCTAKAGWDGPTGFGSPNVKLLMGTATGTGGGTGGGNGGGNGTGGTAANGPGNGSQSNDSGITSGCSASGGAGLLLGLALLGLRRRKR